MEAKGAVTGMVSIAGQYLNICLDELKNKYDLQINRVTQILTIPAATYGPFALEPDFLRTYDLFYPMPASLGATTSGNIIFLTQITMEQFDAEFKSPSIANYPYEYASDLSTQAQVWSGGTQGSGTLVSAGGLYIYPQTSGNLQITHRYMKNQPDLVTPESSNQTPWFPYDDYLIKQTAARMMGVTGDDRQKEYLADCKDMLKPYLCQQGDEQKAVHKIKLDPRHFQSARGLKPVKAYPF
jgi:hypothetical protein